MKLNISIATNDIFYKNYNRVALKHGLLAFDTNRQEHFFYNSLNSACVAFNMFLIGVPQSG